jgi:hypothetical protein
VDGLKRCGLVAHSHPVGADNDPGAGSAEAEIESKVSKAFGIEVTEIAARVFEEWLEELLDIRIVSLLKEGPLDDPRSPDDEEQGTARNVAQEGRVLREYL